jgi:hypothetical protein
VILSNSGRSFGSSSASTLRDTQLSLSRQILGDLGGYQMRSSSVDSHGDEFRESRLDEILLAL